MIIGVTGANGFIGQQLCKQLRMKGHGVLEVDLPGGDIKDIDTLYKLHDAEVIYHLAVLPLYNCNEDYKNCIETNITGTVNVMTIARKYGIKRVIYSSASSVYGDMDIDFLPAHELDVTNPVTIYGMSKLAGEYIVKIMSENFELIGGIFRFTNVYGPGQRNGIIPVVINKLLNDDIIEITGTGEQTRDFVYVTDVVAFLIKALDNPMYSFTANLGSNRKVSINDIVKMCSDYSSTVAKVKHIPMTIDRKHFFADTSELRRLFGEYDFINLTYGLRDTVFWWMRQHADKKT